MKKTVLFLFVLLLACSLQAQEQTTPKDSIILRRFFHAFGKSCKKTGKAVKTVAFNAKQKYHDAPRAANAFDKRFSISLNAGGNYYADFGRKHFPLDTGNIERETNYSRPSHVSYTHVPGFSFHGGLVCSFQISRHFSVEGGLMYFSRRSKEIYSSDANEIALMDSLNNYPFANYFYSKEISQNSQSIEIPFYFGYTHKRFSALIGTRLILVMIDHKRHVRIDNSVQNSNEIWQPFGEGNQAIDFTIPSIKLRYLINKEKIPISVYCSADWLLNKKWDLVAGVQVGIFSK